MVQNYLNILGRSLRRSTAVFPTSQPSIQRDQWVVHIHCSLREVSFAHIRIIVHTCRRGSFQYCIPSVWASVVNRGRPRLLTDVHGNTWVRPWALDVALDDRGHDRGRVRGHVGGIFVDAHGHSIPTPFSCSFGPNPLTYNPHGRQTRRWLNSRSQGAG